MNPSDRLSVDEIRWREAVIADFKMLQYKIRVSAGFNVVTFFIALAALALEVLKWIA